MAKNRMRERTKQRPFFMIYHDMLDSDVLDNHYQKLVCVYLKKHCNAENSCYPSANTLSKETKISVSKIKVTLAELEQKGIVTKENRRRADGGKSSNLYIFNDYEEVWKIKNEEEIKDIAKRKREEVSLSEIPLEELEKEIERRKKKEPETSEPTKVTEESDSQQLTQEKYIVENEKSQEVEEKYPLEWLKNHYEYEQMVEECPEEQETIDNVMQILYEDMNTSAKTIRVGKENKPKEAYISKMMKLTSKGILYAVRKYREVTEPIGNTTNYMRTLLYRAEEQRHLDNLNKQAIQNNQYNNDQGGSLPSENKELQERCWGMTKSHARYLNYSQRDYTKEEWDDMEIQLLALSVPT